MARKWAWIPRPATRSLGSTRNYAPAANYINLYNTGPDLPVAGNGPGSIAASATYVDVTGQVPEPASWAMLIAGFGLSGAAMRRRRVFA